MVFVCHSTNTKPKPVTNTCTFTSSDTYANTFAIGLYHGLPRRHIL